MTLFFINNSSLYIYYYLFVLETEFLIFCHEKRIESKQFTWNMTIDEMFHTQYTIWVNEFQFQTSLNHNWTNVLHDIQ
jgi:hypothetical protein